MFFCFINETSYAILLIKELFALLKGIIQKQRVSDIDKNKIKGGT